MTRRSAGMQARLAAAALAAAVSVGSAQPPPAEETSQPARLAARSLLLDVTRTGDRLVAVGDRGHVLTSDDGGASWRQVEGVPTRAMLTGVCFAGAQGYAVGHDEVILVSRDRGASWQLAHHEPEAEQPLLDVWCGADGRAIAIGAYSSMYVTRDAGDSWVARTLEAEPLAAAAGDAQGLPLDPHLNRIAAGGDDRLYIGAEAGQLYRSDDGGETWRTLPSPYEGSFYGLLPLGSPDELLAFGLRGHLFRTKDGGGSWQRLETGTVAMLTDGVRLADGRIAIVGLSGTVLLSDEGPRFRLLQQPDRRGLAAVLGAGPEALLAVGEGGVKIIPIGR